jgi:hemerythrin
MDTATKQFISELNKLSNAMKNGEGREYVIFALDYLRDYAFKHLELEKKVMLQYEFYETDNHCIEHSKLLSEVENLMKSFEEKGADHGMPLSVQRLMSGWLVRHISRPDKVLGDYLVSKIDIRSRAE